ncbi:MAG: Signal transduction histidine kinase [Parcubacteria group bacterium GW2011_GWA1_47_8]|nr:MAG: Signal transduction histidine kinase [Parcubacteria group bacterium GW2011_GWA1_47_8]
MILRGYRGVFSFSIAGVTFWNISILLFYLDIVKDFNWVVPAHFFAILLAVSFYLFALKFPREIKVKTNAFFVRALPVSLFLVMSGLIVFTHLIVGQVNYDSHSYLIGKYYPLYGLLLGYYLVGGTAILLRQHKDAEAFMEKQQILFVLIGAFISIVVSTITDLIFPYLNIFNYIWVGPFSTVTLVASVSFAILKYHLFNIKLILVEMSLLLLNLFLLVNVFLSQGGSIVILNAVIFVAVLTFSVLLLRGIYKDIRDRERIEGLVRDLAVANDRLRYMEHQKTEFVSIASHQLRTPLTAIKGYASMALEGSFGALSENARKAMDTLYKTSEKIATLVDDLLTVSRLEQGRGALQFRTIDLAKLAREVLDGFKEEVVSSGHRFLFEHEGGRKFLVSVDEQKMKQIVWHILENAIQYSPSLSMVRVSLSRDEEAKMVRLTVSDTGKGMTEEQIASLVNYLDPLQDSHAKADAKKIVLKEVTVKGSEQVEIEQTPGIGLYIANEILHAHRGHIRVTSPGVDKGTTFVVELPRVGEGDKI